MIRCLLVVLALALSPAGCGDTDEAGACAATCGGCCIEETCLPGTDNTACGVAGAACTTCGAGTSCQQGVCQPQTSCQTGCVDSTGSCLPGNTGAACGTNGGPCQSCGTGQSCIGGKCEAACNHLSCPDGCCSGTQCVSPPTDSACGANGAACVACSATQTCTQGFCADDQQDCSNCSGCCSNNKCLPGNTVSACGANGDPCASCSTGQECKAGSCAAVTQPCDSTSCPAGCCTANNVCLPPSQQDATACGNNGDACAVCGSGSTCQQGTCVSSQPCFTYCKSGCCTSQGQCLDYTSQDATSCGSGGTLCQACPSGQSCLAGACQNDPVWEIWVVSAVLSSQLNGGDWDGWPQNPLPDPYVYITANPSYPCTFINTDCGYTQTITNTITPNWDQKVVAKNLGLITTKPWQIQVLDSDTPLSPDVAGSCTLNITTAMLNAGTHTIGSCGQNVSSLVLKFVKQ